MSEDDGQFPGGQPNPLFIPSLVEKLLSLCFPKELKICRLVCREWNDEAWKHLRKKSEIVFLTQEQVQDYLILSSQSSCFLQPINFKLGPDVNLCNKSSETFFSQYGQGVQSLHFDRTKWSGAELREILLYKVPNLESLTINIHHYSVNNTSLFEESHDTFLTLPKINRLSINCNFMNFDCKLLNEIFYAVPNIETLSSTPFHLLSSIQFPSRQLEYLRLQRLARPRWGIPIYYNNNIPQFANNLAHFAVRNPRRYGDLVLSQLLININSSALELRNLSYLDFDLVITDSSELHKLKDKKLPIKRLSMVLCETVTTEAVHDFLKSLGATLRFLKLNYSHKLPSHHGLPFMKELSHLHLEEYKGNLQFLQTLPTLSTLVFTNLDFASVLSTQKRLDESKNKKPHTLNTLLVEKNTVKIYMSRVVNVMCKSFPYLKKIKLEHLTDEPLRLMFTHLPGVEELSATDGFFTDSGITGIPLKFCKQIAGSSQIKEFDVGKLKLFPNVGFLKNLKTIRLGSPKITDVSLEYGICHCKYLERLSMNSNKASSYTLDTIKTTLDLIYITEFEVYTGQQKK